MCCVVEIFSNCVALVNCNQLLVTWSNILSTFTEPRSMPEDVANVGERLLLKLYGVIRSTSLDKLRVTMYTWSISWTSLDSVIRVHTWIITTNCCRCQVSFLSCLSCIATTDWEHFVSDWLGLAVEGGDVTPTDCRSERSSYMYTANRAMQL